MSSQPLPPEIADAIQNLDKAAAGWPPELLAEWKKVRGYCRSKHSESQRVLPAASLAVQEISMASKSAQSAIQHAQNAMGAMSGVFGQSQQPKEPDTAKHKVIPEDGEDR